MNTLAGAVILFIGALLFTGGLVLDRRRPDGYLAPVITGAGMAALCMGCVLPW